MKEGEFLDFHVHKRSSSVKRNYSSETIDVAYRFAKEIHKELKDLIKAIVLFGSAARQTSEVNDIDILLVVDDISIKFSPELVQTYRIIVEKTVAKVSTKIHITSMKFTSFWEYVRAGDPVAVNILRDGYPLLDTGFFEPIQMLLYQGRIRPSQEALWAYFNRAPRTLRNSRARIYDAVIDLYWAVIDAAHAALMSINEVPPSPSHVADLLDQKLAKQGLIDKKLPWTMRKMYSISKDILSGRKKTLTGQEFEKLYLEADTFVKAMQKFIAK